MRQASAPELEEQGVRTHLPGHDRDFFDELPEAVQPTSQVLGKRASPVVAFDDLEQCPVADASLASQFPEFMRTEPTHGRYEDALHELRSTVRSAGVTEEVDDRASCRLC